MTKEIALAKITELVAAKKIRKHSQAYKTIIRAIDNPGEVVPCGKNTGSGRYSSSISWKNQVVMLLMQAGINYSTGNSAPRGGAAGDNIAIHLD